MSQRLRIMILIAVNLLIACWAFRAFFVAPHNYMLENRYDGLKNHYTFLYHQQSEDRSLLHFTGMNYPYGESVLYTDNSPLISVPLKLVGNILPVVKHNAQPIYIFIIICNFILAVVIAYLLIIKLTGNTIVASVCATLMVWLSPQFERISAGHYSLTFISLTLLIIYLTTKIWETNKEMKRMLLFSILLTITGYMSFFLHGYYIFLFGFWIGYFLLIGAILNKQYKLAVAAFTIPTLILALSFITLKLIDPSLNFRGDAVIGYGYYEWASRLECLITAPEKLSIKFPYRTGYTPNYENAGYLGNAILYGIPLMLLALLVTKKRQDVPIKEVKLLVGLLVASILLLFISFGEKYYSGNGNLLFINKLNPVLYLRGVFPKFTHIRCPARFQWFFFIAMYTLLAVLVHKLLSKTKNSYSSILVVSVVAVIGAIDLHNSLKPYYENEWTHNNVFNSPVPHPDISRDKYDAILTIPFYHAGSTDINYTLETDEDFMANALQLSVQTGLPLMSCKMSRTPDYQAKTLINLFLTDTADKDLKQKLTGKRILVVKSNLVYADTLKTYKPKYAPAYTAFAKGPEIVGKFNMDTLGTFGNFTYYKWKP